MKRKKLIPMIAGIVLMVLSFLLAVLLSVPTLGEQTIRFESTYKEDKVTLTASYKEVKGASYAALICPGYSCDREKWRPVSDLLVSNGITTMRFDYSGQGASYGTIGFDNAKTDAIPEEIDDALEVLHDKTGIPYENIILVGHSMGGRSILRLLYDYNNSDAETTVSKKNIGNAILLSPEVNYQTNAQASLFAGTSDAEEDPWKDFGYQDIGTTNIYLYGSTGDDIVSSYDILRMFERMTGETVLEKGTYDETAVNPNGTKVTVGIKSGVLHSYMMYSPKYASYINDALTDITGVKSTYNPYNFVMIYVSWFAGLAGLGLLLYTLTWQPAKEIGEDVPVLTSTKKFLLQKLLLWLPGLGFAFLICCLCVVMPFGSPIMNTPYMCCIAGYGIIMFIFYKKHKVKGITEEFPKMTLKIKSTKKDILLLIVTILCTIFFVWAVLWATMYRLIPLNVRIFWVLFATALMAIGYYVSSIECDMLTKSGVKWWVKLLYNLIQYVALFLLVLFYFVIKSYSGFIGQVQNMVLMYVFTVPLGTLITRKTGNRLYGAILSAFLFQTLMITSAALISMF